MLVHHVAHHRTNELIGLLGEPARNSTVDRAAFRGFVSVRLRVFDGHGEIRGPSFANPWLGLWASDAHVN